jgi:zinc transport system permease protein
MDTLIFYFKTYPVVTYSTIVLTLVSLCAALLGVSLVLKRFSMIGDGLSHVAFGATAVATAASFAPIYVALPFTVVAAVLLLRIRSNAKIMGDAAIAMISAGSLAFGYMILNLFPSKSASVSGDACTSLFGSASIIGIKKSDVAVCAILALFVLFVFIFFYHKIFAVTFDESFATATGTKAEVYNTMLAIITGVVIVIAMNMVGALLITALITFPALSAMRIFKTFKKVIICAASIACSCALIGTVICIIASTPVGPTIAIANIVAFGIFYLVGTIKERVR